MAHKNKKSLVCAVLDEQKCLVVWTVQSPLQAIAECWVDSFKLVVQYRNFCCPIEYQSSGQCRHCPWQNKDDSTQHPGR